MNGSWWYKVERSNPKCGCERKATHDVFNRYNALVGSYCRRCANAMIKSVDANAVRPG